MIETNYPLILNLRKFGSLLSKNPELADRLLKIALKKKYNKDIELEPLDDTFELKAKKHIIDTFKNNNK